MAIRYTGTHAAEVPPPRCSDFEVPPTLLARADLATKNFGYSSDVATLAAAAIRTTANTVLIRLTGANPTARPPIAAPISEPADMAETIRFGPRPVAIAH